MKLIISFFTICLGLQAQILKLDQNFGLNGIVSFDQISWSSDIVNPVLLKFDEGLYLVHGVRYAPKPNQLTLVKIDTFGNLDLSYFNKGINILSFNLDTIGDYKTIISSINFYPSVKQEIVVSCKVRNIQNKKNAHLLFRINLLGKIDSTFGNNGILIFFPDTNKLTLTSELSIDTFGQIYFLNHYLDSFDNKYYIDISKFAVDGSYDTGFASNGKISIALSDPSNVPKIFLDGSSNLYISYSNTNDSTAFVSSFTSNGSLAQNFGINGLLKFRNLIGQIQPYFSNILFHNEFLYLCSSQGSTTGLTIVKIDKKGNLDVSFNNSGFLHIDESENNAYSFHAFDHYLVCFRPNDLKPVQNLLINYNGTPCCGNNFEWKLSFDSIPLSINEDQISLYEDELYFVAKSRASGANPRNLLILNFKLDLTTTTQNAEPNDLACFPNPFKKTIQIKDLQSDWPFLSVYDGLGRNLLKKELKTESDRILESSNWNNGIYYFILQDRNRQKQYIFKRIHIQD